MKQNHLFLYKEKLIEILEAFDKLCITLGLKYYACGGTAIGAIRHQNIIPWDDDIDVYMQRTDYDKLLAYSVELNRTNQYKIAKLGDKGYIYSFAKFYDGNTTLVELKEYPSCIIGVYIDVFPVDEVSEDLKEIGRNKREYMKLYHNFQSTYHNISLRFVVRNLIKFNFSYLFQSIYCRYCSEGHKEKIRGKFMEYERVCAESHGDYLLTYVGIYPLQKEVFPKEWLDQSVYVAFGRTKIQIMSRYHEYLTHLFGDYMTPPPDSLQVSHHYHYYLNLKEGLSAEEVKERIAKGEHLVI